MLVDTARFLAGVMGTENNDLKLRCLNCCNKLSMHAGSPLDIPWTMAPEYVAIARRDDFSPSAVEAYQMVASSSPVSQVRAFPVS